jgi:hypothetical protein
MKAVDFFFADAESSTRGAQVAASDNRGDEHDDE